MSRFPETICAVCGRRLLYYRNPVCSRPSWKHASGPGNGMKPEEWHKPVPVYPTLVLDQK